ncbi:DUF6160 family protein [Pseudomonas aeruginosa]|uniref:DUF6160 family protein n=1 Tax=Pseudomonas aeruginosa TaxID=287 RepID=UPI003F3E8597
MKCLYPVFCLALRGSLPLLFAVTAHAELRSLEDETMAQISGRDGLSLSGTFSLVGNPADTRCSGGCGVRLSFQPTNSTGFVVMDNVKGTFSFDSTTLDLVTIDSGFNGEGKLFSREAMRVGLANFTVDNLRFTLGGANQSRPASGLQQTDLLTYQATGAVKLTGNLYLFGQP